MRALRTLARSACAAVTLAAVTHAQVVDVGNRAPDFGGDWYNHRDAHLSELAGRVVYIEFWGGVIDESWERDRVSYLKRLGREYADKGLFILVVSHASQEDLEEIVKDWWIDFPIALLDGEEGRRVSEQYGGNAAIIDHEGTLTWRGSVFGLHFNRLDDMLEETSIIELLPEEHEKINRYLRFSDLDLGKAHKALFKAYDRDPEDEHLARAMAELELIWADQLERVETLIADRDYGVAHARLQEMVDAWDGSLLEDQANAMRIDLKRNPDAKDDIKAYDKFLEAEDKRRIRKYEDARELYEDIVRNFAGTKCAERSEYYLRQI